jgi:hypothetical protein
MGSKSKFEFMNFTGGASDNFVVHAGKFTKEEVVDIMVRENDWMFDGKNRKPTVEDVKEAWIRYYPSVPQRCGFSNNDYGGCYTFCDKAKKSAFLVWVISYADLAEHKLKEQE